MNTQIITNKVNNSKRLLLLVFLLLFSIVFSGCNAMTNSDIEKNEQTVAAKPLIESYLNNICSTYELKKLEKVKARCEGYPSYSAKYDSDYAYSEINIDSKTYHLYINTATNEIWSDYYSYILDNILTAQIAPICEKYGLHSDVKLIANNYNYIHTFSGPNETTLEVDIESCLPANITPENISDNTVIESMLDGLILSCCELTYNSEDNDLIPQIIDEYYSTYHPVAYENYTASCIAKNSLDNTELTYTLTAVDSSEGISEIFWKYQYPSEDFFRKYVVYESE